MIGDVIEVHNRKPTALSITKDGREYTVPPGRSWIRSDLIVLGKNQNPVMGTEDPGSTVTESYLSVVAKNPANQVDPLDDYPEDVVKLLPKERINRDLLAPDRQVIDTVHRPDFPTRRVGVESPSAGMVEAGQKF